jgi:hypothetical protein
MSVAVVALPLEHSKLVAEATTDSAGTVLTTA